MPIGFIGGGTYGGGGVPIGFICGGAYGGGVGICFTNDSSFIEIGLFSTICFATSIVCCDAGTTELGWGTISLYIGGGGGGIL